MIAMQVQVDTLEQVLEVENAITAPFENLDLVIETFNETAVLSMDKVVGDLLPPPIEHFQEAIKTLQVTSSNLLYPALDYGLCLFLGQVHIKNGRQSFTKHIGLFCRRGMLEEDPQLFSFFFVQIPTILAKSAQTALEFLIFLFRQFFLQAMQSCFLKLSAALR